MGDRLLDARIRTIGRRSVVFVAVVVATFAAASPGAGAIHRAFVLKGATISDDVDLSRRTRTVSSCPPGARIP